MFLYFLELMGIGDVADLSLKCQIIAKNDDEKKLKAVLADLDESQISFDKLVFFSLDKRAVLQKKFLKKVCKLFVGGVVDNLPDNSSFLTDVIQRVVVFSTSTHRLVRYAFTFVGLYLYKCLLSQQRDLAQLKTQLETKRKNEEKLKQDQQAAATHIQVKAISQAYDIVKTAALVLQKRVLMKRIGDVQEIVRKSVYEFIL